MYWKLSFWVLLAAWITGAYLHGKPCGGLFTSYLADLTFPPFYYIFLRGLYRTPPVPTKVVFFGTWFSETPLRCAVSIFLGGTVTEIKTLYWPEGFIRGTFDPWDIAAYAFGLLICVGFDRK